MIFLGDVACPDERIDSFQKWSAKEEMFRDQVVILNLEANIVDNSIERKNLTLYNVSKIADIFPYARKIIVSLANNHMYDYPEKILETKAYLESKGIGVFGLYEDNDVEPYIFEDNGVKYAFFGHCWRLYTHTNRNLVNNVRIVDCGYDEFIERVKKYKTNNPNIKVFCFMHWNYDLEAFPLPMHRKIARELIDSGVEGVIGGHSHRPQGMEYYKGKPIVYCMGNFYLPSGLYFQGKLKYPECSKITYGVQFQENNIKTVWWRTDVSNVQPLELECEETFAKGEHCKKYSPFIDMNEDEYLLYFKKNRKKKVMVAKFTEPYDKKYLIDEKWAEFRIKILRKIKGIMKK